MNREEILNINKLKNDRSEFIFEDDSLLYPTKIIFNSPTYGRYILTRAAYINIIGPDYMKISKANTEVRELSYALSTYSIKESMGQSVEFVIYLCDADENTNWADENKDNSLVKSGVVKDLPVAAKGLKEKLNEFYKKYPMVKL